jgi:NADH-quinone oxidoreductase subunit E
MEESKALLGLEDGGVTEDGLFSIDPVRCVGCCGLSPVIVVGSDTYGRLTKDQLPAIFAKYKNS